MNRKNKNYKRYLALLEKESEIEKAIKNLGYVELDKPIHKGYDAYLVLRDDIARRDDAWVFQYMIDNFSTHPWSNSRVFYTPKKPWNDNRPKLNKISEEAYKRIPPQVSKYFYYDYREDKYLWNNTVKRYYSTVCVPEHFFVVKIKKSYLTHKRVIDGELESQLQFIRDEIYRISNYTYFSGNGRGYTWFRKSYNQKDRAYNKRVLKFNLKAEFPFSVEDSDTREGFQDLDWTSWNGSSAWSHDPKDFRYKARNSAKWMWW